MKIVRLLPLALLALLAACGADSITGSDARPEPAPRQATGGVGPFGSGN